MKKFFSLTLALILILGMCLQLAPVNAAETDLKPLPQTGEVISGFKAIEVGNMELIHSKTVLFEHEKTGAKLLYIQNKDIDRSFDISFKTPAVNDTGANHILEHISVSGSQKYPLKNVLFTIANQTYSTFINAFTSQTYTSYPVSSMSETQLLKLTDVYMDCVYNPSVYNDKNIFLREAWRYEMADANAPLTINGTVYNEMKGALGSISSAARNNVLDVLYPNSIQSNISGGDPEKIKDLTYEQIINTHKTYYHPSNSLMILYGNLDYTKFLKLINDDYLSKFDKKDVKVEDGEIAPLQQKSEQTFKFPVAAASNTKNAAQIDYAYALTDVSEEDVVGLTILATVLNQAGSPLKQLFHEEQIGGNVTVSLDYSLTQPVLTFSAQSADENKKEEFKALVDNCIIIMKNGFDKDAVDAVISAVMLSNSNMTEMANLGVNLSMSAGLMWANYDNTNYLNNLIKNIKNISDKISADYLENLTTKYIQNNNHAALVTTIPEAGLAEKQSEQQQKYLSDLKASMSKQEIEKIVSNTKLYNEWNSRETDQADQNIVKELQVVKVADLPVEVKKYDIKDNLSSDGIRIISTEANVGETGLTSLLLDTSAIPIEKLHYLQLYSGLLGKLDTESYTNEQLDTLFIRYLNGAAFSISTIPQKDWNNFTPVLAISWIGLMGEYDKQLDLVKEVLLNTEFTDSDTISNVVKSQIADIRNQITNNPVNLLASRNLALSNDCSNYSNYVSNLDYYNFLIQLDQTLQSDPNAVLTELNDVKKLVLNKTNMITMFAGNENSVKKYEGAIKSVIDALPANAITKQDYSKLPKPALKEGIAIDTSVQYNMISAEYEKMGTTFNGKYIPIGSVINENYITPKIRFGYGAYDNIVSFSSNGFMLISYRDPNIKETFDVYKELPEFVKNINMTQEELDRYILKAFSNYTSPSGELAGASNAINNYLMGNTSEDQLKVLREIKSATVQDIKDSSAMFEGFIKNGAYSTVGSTEKLNASKDLYDSIISFGQQTNEAITRAQFFELILAGVPNPIEVAKQQGLLKGDGKGNYYENDKLTREQLAVIVNRLASLYGMQFSGDGVKISDIASISPWAVNSVKAIVASGVVKLDANGSFNPQEDVTVSLIQAIMSELTKKLTAN
ncbi:MAG: insulinase family protein [Clostridiaceae bacterium]